MSASRTPFFKLPRLAWAAPSRALAFWRRLFARAEADGAVPAPQLAPPTSSEPRDAPASPPSPVVSERARGDRMPRPALRWLGERASIALRSFDYAHDIEAVAAFQRDNYELNFPEFSYSREFEEAFRIDIRRAAFDPNHAIFVLDEAGARSRVVGFVWLVVCENGWTNERYGYINNLYLLPEKRGQGLASDLLSQSDSFFRTRRIRRVRLTVTASNERALALYERSGFATTRWEMEKDIS